MSHNAFMKNSIIKIKELRAKKKKKKPTYIYLGNIQTTRKQGETKKGSGQVS